MDFISLIVFIYFSSRVFCYDNSFDIAENIMHLKDRATKLSYFFQNPLDLNFTPPRDHNTNEVVRLCPQVVVLPKSINTIDVISNNLSNIEYLSPFDPSNTPLMGLILSKKIFN